MSKDCTVGLVGSPDRLSLAYYVSSVEACKALEDQHVKIDIICSNITTYLCLCLYLSMPILKLFDPGQPDLRLLPPLSPVLRFPFFLSCACS